MCEVLNNKEKDNVFINKMEKTNNEYVNVIFYVYNNVFVINVVNT